LERQRERNDGPASGKRRSTEKKKETGTLAQGESINEKNDTRGKVGTLSKATSSRTFPQKRRN